MCSILIVEQYHRVAIFLVPIILHCILPGQHHIIRFFVFKRNITFLIALNNDSSDCVSNFSGICCVCATMGDQKSYQNIFVLVTDN